MAPLLQLIQCHIIPDSPVIAKSILDSNASPLLWRVAIDMLARIGGVGIMDILIQHKDYIKALKLRDKIEWERVDELLSMSKEPGIRGLNVREVLVESGIINTLSSPS